MTSIDQYPEVRAVNQQADTIASQVNDLVVETVEDYERGAGLLRHIKSARTKLEDLRTSITKPMNDALRAANALFREPGEKLESLERTIKNRMAIYHQAQEKIRLEQEAKLREDARRERERIEAEARAARRKAEAEAAKLRAKAAAAAETGDLASAQKFDSKADATVEKASGMAGALERGASMIGVPNVESAAPKVAGVATRKVIKFEITDEALVPAEYKVIDKVKLRRVVFALKMQAKIPGVKVWEESEFAARAEDSDD